MFPQHSNFCCLLGTSGLFRTLRSLSVSAWPEPSEEDGGGSTEDGGNGREDPASAKATGEITLEAFLGGVKDALCAVVFPF